MPDVASSDFSGLMRIWDLETGRPLQAMTLDEQSVQNVEFLDSSHLLVTPQTGPNALILTTDVDELLDIARNRVTRGFTTGGVSGLLAPACLPVGLT